MPMNCERLADLLIDYLEGALGPADTQCIEEHLASCACCGKFVRTYQTTMSVAGELTEEPMPDDLRYQLHVNLRQRLKLSCHDAVVEGDPPCASAENAE